MDPIDADQAPEFKPTPLPPNITENADPQDVWMMEQLDVQRQQNGWLIQSSLTNRSLTRSVINRLDSDEARIKTLEDWRIKFGLKEAFMTWAAVILATSGLTYIGQWVMKKFFHVLIAFALGLCGCSYFAPKAGTIQAKQDERTREVIQAAKVANDIGRQRRGSTNEFVAYDLSGDFLRRGQSIVGLPIADQTGPVYDLLSEVRSVRQAAEDKERSRAMQEQGWASERAALQAKLVEMGQKYEEEKNKSIVKRVWHWLIGTLGIGGLIALCIFCPAVIPIFGHILGWLVSRVPKIAGAIGVVSTKAFDSVVRGIQRTKAEAGASPHTDTLLSNLSREMDHSHKCLVSARIPAQKLAA